MPFSNEQHLEQTFVDHLTVLAHSLTGTEIPALVIGRQVSLLTFDIPDLLACDASGRFYLIEAKLCRNPEIQGKVFSQLERYLSVIREAGFDWLAGTLVDGFRKHWQLPFPHTLPAGGWQTLDAILDAWHRFLGAPVPPGKDLAARLAAAVSQERIVPVVLADGIPHGWYPPERVRGSSELLQVLALDQTGGLLKHLGGTLGPVPNGRLPAVQLTPHDEWIRRRTRPARTLADFREKLFPPAYRLIQRVIVPWVGEYGFSVEARGNAKSLSLCYRGQEVLAVGLSDDDSKQQRNQFGYDPLRVLKVNPIFRRISPKEQGVAGLRAEHVEALDKAWRRLQLECGFRRRGDNSRHLPGDAGFKSFQTADYPRAPKWHGEFKRQFRGSDGSVRQDFYDEQDEPHLRRTLAIVTELARVLYG